MMLTLSPSFISCSLRCNLSKPGAVFLFEILDRQVARYTALVFGITYGIFHQSTLQARYDEKKVSWACQHLSLRRLSEKERA